MANRPDAHCQNCGSPLYGEHCYACGQPTKGLVRHVRSVAGDVVDTLFNIDSRLLRTLPALLFRPGFLSLEYFEGRRIRYVSPVRLFFVLCITAFFAARLAMPTFEIDGDDRLVLGESGEVVAEAGDEDGSLERATSVSEVEARLAASLADIETARREGQGVPGLGGVLDEAEAGVRAEAAARIAELEATTNAPEVATTEGGDPDADGTTPELNFNGRPWHPETNPVVIASLPEAANDWLNAQIGHIPQNWKRIREDPNLLSNAFFSALPTALFVLVPVFALLLKVLYLFEKRLYMEHLVVALHGHAFVCAMLLLETAAGAVEDVFGGSAWLSASLGWLTWVGTLWAAIYLWLQLRRVYGQGVVLTTVKYVLLAFIEVVLLSIVASGALLAALVWL